MVRRVNKGQKNKISAVSESSAAQNPVKSPGGLTTVKLLAVIAVALAFIYGPSLFKKSATVEAPSKLFKVKEVAHFSGDDIQGTAFFANDIVPVGDHQLAITDNLGAQVILCDYKGKLIRKWGKNGSGSKEFREPSSIASDGKGRLFVLDSLNGMIKVFNPEGNFLSSVNLSSANYFPNPRRLGWDGNSFLVANYGDARLFRLSSKGELLSTWGEKGVGVGGLWGTSKPVVDDKGRYYVGDSNTKDSRVRVYDGTGAVVQEIKTGVPAESLGLDSKGRLFVVSYGSAAKVFDAKGDWLGCLVDEAQPTVLLNQIAGIKVLPNGLLLTCGGNVITIYQLVGEKD